MQIILYKKYNLLMSKLYLTINTMKKNINKKFYYFFTLSIELKNKKLMSK
jgi:hypothetical protein